MKILKIRHCGECKYNDYIHDTRTDLGRFICKHPEFKTKYRTYKIINRVTALKGGIPYWCPLEDYKVIGFIHRRGEPEIYEPEVEIDNLEDYKQDEKYND